MDLLALQQLLSAVAGVRVLAVGDLMVDRFVYGEVSRISPEAPIPIMSRAHEIVMLGGAGNVARNVASLGAAARLVGVIGKDGAGNEALRLLADEAEVEGFLVTDPDRPTTKSLFRGFDTLNSCSAPIPLGAIRREVRQRNPYPMSHGAGAHERLCAKTSGTGLLRWMPALAHCT